MNYKYQFSVRVPEGWQVSDQLPDLVQEVVLVGYEKKSVPVVFYNRRTRGLIYIYVKKIDRPDVGAVYQAELLNRRLLFLQYEKTRHSLMSSFLQTEKTIKSNPLVIDYSYEHGPESECEFSETFLVEHPYSLDLYKNINTYRCYHDKNHFYLAILNLSSWSYTFDKNHEVFEEFIEHFKASNFMYGKDEAEK
jgi:hypothetical protein